MGRARAVQQILRVRSADLGLGSCGPRPSTSLYRCLEGTQVFKGAARGRPQRQALKQAVCASRQLCKQASKFRPPTQLRRQSSWSREEFPRHSLGVSSLRRSASQPPRQAECASRQLSTHASKLRPSTQPRLQSSKSWEQSARHSWVVCASLLVGAAATVTRNTTNPKHTVLKRGMDVLLGLFGLRT